MRDDHRYCQPRYFAAPARVAPVQCVIDDPLGAKPHDSVVEMKGPECLSIWKDGQLIYVHHHLGANEKLRIRVDVVQA